MTAKSNAREGDGVGDHVAVLCRLRKALPDVGLNGWIHGVAALDWAIAELTAMQAQQGAEPVAWIPVSERLPPDGDVVLCFEPRKLNRFTSQFCADLCGDGKPGFVEEYYDKSPTTDGCKGGWGHWPYITHWQPLPAAPATGAPR